MTMMAGILGKALVDALCELNRYQLMKDRLDEMGKSFPSLGPLICVTYTRVCLLQEELEREGNHD